MGEAVGCEAGIEIAGEFKLVEDQFFTLKLLLRLYF
jgi:hypothetical protein